MGSTALADILIALAMCWCLYHKRTGFAKWVSCLFPVVAAQVGWKSMYRTDSIIMTLMSYSVNSGMLTRWVFNSFWETWPCRRTRIAFLLSACLSLYDTSFISCVNTSLWLHQFVAAPTRLIWEQFFWLMGKCMLALRSDEEEIWCWHLYRLCELLPCYVRETFAFKSVLTSIAFRLNSRDSLRERSADNVLAGLRMSVSVQQDRTRPISKTEPTPVSVTVHSTTTTEFAEGEHDDESDKHVGVLHALVALRNWGSHAFWREEFVTLDTMDFRN